MSEQSGLLHLMVNGIAYDVRGTGSERLSAILRDTLGLTGTKIGCEAGDCGACTVLVDYEPACACLLAVGQVTAASITTIEGIANVSPSGARLLDAFHQAGAVQCGACTPGMIMAGAALLDAAPHPTDAEIETALTGVLCRCTGYQKIVDAVIAAARQMNSWPETARRAS